MADEEIVQANLEQARRLAKILDPLYGVECAQLRRVAAGLIQRGGEFTACGKALNQAIDAVYPAAPRTEKKKMGFEEGYGGLTFPMGKGR